MQDVSPFRVLFFESWTKGVVNCHRIMNAAPAGVFEFKLLHIRVPTITTACRRNIISEEPNED
jgi:hypothetical protein